MDVLILGYGLVGSALAKLLSKEKSVKRITCASRSNGTMTKLPKISFVKVDVSNKKQLLKSIKNADVVVNASLPEFNTVILQCCLKRGVPYMDLATFWDNDPDTAAECPYKVEQLDYDGRFKKKHLVGLINAGVSPGLTNLLARECADDLDSVDSIKIFLAEETNSDKPFFSWSVACLLDEIAWKPLVFQQGSYRIVEYGSESEVAIFPEPIGKKMTCIAAQEELGTIPHFIKAKNVFLKIYDNASGMGKVLLELGFLSEKKMKIDGMITSPVKVTTDILQKYAKTQKTPKNALFATTVEAVGKYKGKKKVVRRSAVFPPQKTVERIIPGATFISYPTALMASLFVTVIPKLKTSGIIAPECLDKETRTSILKRLSMKGVRIQRS